VERKRVVVGEWYGMGGGLLVGVSQSSAAESEQGKGDFGEHGCWVLVLVLVLSVRLMCLMPLTHCADAVLIDRSKVVKQDLHTPSSSQLTPCCHHYARVEDHGVVSSMSIVHNGSRLAN
jgi:hypothetical protein